MNRTDQATKQRIASMPTLPGVPSTGITEQLLEHCATCGYPYVSGFRGYEYVMIDKHVCNGSAAHGLCLPTIYIAVKAPVHSVEVDWPFEGKRFRGVLYEVNE